MLDFRKLRFSWIILFAFYGEIVWSADLVPQPSPSYTRTVASYNIPNVTLVDQEANNVELRNLINYGGPVMVQFIFASCSTICPILSASFSSVQPILDSINTGVYRLISISIDPEQDTPKTLTEYAKRFKAGKNWHFLTGSRDDIGEVLKAFDAGYKGNNKMYHQSLTFMHAGSDTQWIRIEGLLGKNDIVSEFNKTIDPNNQQKE